MKISVIMQTYLGDYPGSRSEPERKFIRAVDCFLAQSHQNKELIIIADGCKKTFDIFHEKYSNYKEIKFCYINKSENRMYDTVDGKRFYRGAPKKIGVSMADGDLITYCDSDDIMLPTRLEDIAHFWKDKDNSFVLSFNSMRWLAQCNVETNSCTKVQDKELDLSDYGIGHKFLLVTAKDGYMVTTSWALTHRKAAGIEWRDTYGIWEDYEFASRMMKAGRVFAFASETYVLCHYTDLWDY
jgi:glycosyltransferase involved in cell wall biosynthesis